MRLERCRPILLSLAAFCAAGCVASGPSLSRGATSPWWIQSRPVPADIPEAPPPQILPETHFTAAQWFESQGAFDKALRQYRKAIAVNHSYVEAYHRLGLLLSRLGRRAEAQAALRRAVQLKPDDPILHNNLGFELLLSDHLAQARGQLARAIDLKPDFARAYVNLGIAMGREGRFTEALERFRAVLPEADAQYNLGLMYRDRKQFADAADAFRRVLSIRPDGTAARTQLDQLAAHAVANAPLGARRGGAPVGQRESGIGNASTLTRPPRATGMEVVPPSASVGPVSNTPGTAKNLDGGDTKQQRSTAGTAASASSLLLAVQRKLEDRLSIIRNEIACLESLPPTAVAAGSGG